MNIFVPQSLQTRIELEEIASVERQLISPKNSKTLVGMVKDSLIGSYVLTSPMVSIDWRNAMNIISYTSIENFDNFKKDKSYTGQEIFSIIIPSGINVNNPTLKIKNGKIVDGRITKDTLKAGVQNNLIQLIWDGYGVEQTERFINDTQRLINNFNLYQGFSLGDLQLEPSTTDDVNKMIKTTEMEIEHFVTNAENNPNLYKIDTYEAKLTSDIAIVSDKSTKCVMGKIPQNNGFVIAIQSGGTGSKGKAENMGQICGCCGQIVFEGKIIPKKFNRRTSVYFHQNDDRAVSRGLVEQSFLRGIEFPEFAFHMLNSRQGIIEGALKTADTGYSQRKLIKSLEDVVVKYDGTIRLSNENIIQFIYGNSGCDTTKQYEYDITFMGMDNKTVADKFRFTEDELKDLDFSSSDNVNLYNTIIEMRDNLRDTISSIKLKHFPLESKFMIPVNLLRIISVVGDSNGTKLQPKYVLDKINFILSNSNTIIICMSKKDLENENSLKNRDIKMHKTIFRASLYDSLSPKKLTSLQISKEQFDKMVSDIINSFNKNMVEPGEMVGIIAAQSCGEPLTQMTLNSLDWEELITIIDSPRNLFRMGQIGKLIDNVMEEQKHKVVHVKDNIPNEMTDTSILDVKNCDFFIKSVNEHGKITPCKIELFTRHLPCNKDGSKKILLVKTKTGLTVKATRAKSFLTRINNKVTAIRGDALKIGMYLPVNKTAISSHVLERLIETEIIPGFNIKGCAETLNRKEITNIISIKSKDKACEKDVTILKEALSSDVYYDQIVSITDVDPSHKYVYDFTVMGNKTFCINNGICCMDSFHHAGIASLSATTGGVPRLKELFGVAKLPKTPQMVIHLEQDFAQNKDMAKKIASYIKNTTLNQIRGRINVYYDTDFSKDNKIMNDDNVEEIFYKHETSKTGCQKTIDGLPWLIRIEFDREKMIEKEITLLDIKSAFCSWWDKRLSDTKSIKKDEIKIINKIIQLAVLSNSDNDVQPIIHIRFSCRDIEKDNFDLNTINGFIELIIDKFKLKGINSISNITDVSASKILIPNSKTGELEKKDEFVIYTAGVNMNAIRYIVGINLAKTYTNDINEMYNVFGIEIARNMIIREILRTYELEGHTLNYNHISLIVDLMTSTGSIISIDRHGMGKSETDPLSRASFEKTVDQLLTAAVFAETDHMKGVSSRIMAGQIIRGGTGMCDVILDTDMLENSEHTDLEDRNKDFNEINTNSLTTDITSKSGEDIFIPV
jgi:DNA-directed RNA polymerase beta' subunit